MSSDAVSAGNEECGNQTKQLPYYTVAKNSNKFCPRYENLWEAKLKDEVQVYLAKSNAKATKHSGSRYGFHGMLVAKFSLIMKNKDYSKHIWKTCSVAKNNEHF